MYQEGDVLKQQFRLDSQLGIGGFSEVWKATDLDAQDVVAIKIFHKQDQEGIDLCRDEFKRLNYLRHPNILRPRFFSHAEDAPFFVMAYCEGGSTMDRAGEFTETELANLILQIGSALNHIHTLKNPILHNDIKPDNILEDQPGEFMLADFGLSDRLSKKLSQSIPDDQRTQQINDEKKAGITPMAYRAPELFNFSGRPQSPPSKQTDIWAFGACIYQLATEDLPFDNEGGLRQLTYYQAKEDLQITDIVAPLPDQFSRSLDTLLKQCMAIEPVKRPSAKYLVDKADHFLRTGDWALGESVDEPAKPAAPVTVAMGIGQKQVPTGERSGKISLDNTEVDFGAVKKNVKVSQTLNVQYGGLEDKLFISASEPFLVSISGLEPTASIELPVVGEQGTQMIEVHYEAEESGDVEGNLYVSHPDYGQEMVPLRAQAAKPLLASAWWPYGLVGGAVVLVLGLILSQGLFNKGEDTSKIEEPVVIGDSVVIDVKNSEDEPNDLPDTNQPEESVEPTLPMQQGASPNQDDDGGGNQGFGLSEISGDQEAKNDSNNNNTQVVNPIEMPPCNLELRCSSATKKVGAVASDRCGTDDDRDYVQSAKIIFKAKKNLIIKSAVVYADNGGTLRMSIRDKHSSTCEFNYDEQNVAKGINQVNFILDFTLLEGQEYELNINTENSSFSKTPPKLENLRKCEPTMVSSRDLDVVYNGNVVLCDIMYCY